MTRIANISSIDWTHQARRQQTRSEGDHLRKVASRLFFAVSTDEGTKVSSLLFWGASSTGGFASCRLQSGVQAATVHPDARQGSQINRILSGE
jgi:hypothetical protein